MFERKITINYNGLVNTKFEEDIPLKFPAEYLQPVPCPQIINAYFSDS